MKRQNTDNYNKNYFTAGGIPQPAAEIVPQDEKADLTQEGGGKPQPEPELTGPDHDPEIARAMGQVKKER